MLSYATLHALSMLWLGVLLSIIYGNYLYVTGALGGMNLVSVTNSLCLAVESGTSNVLAETCDKTNPRQKWRWLGQKHLQNVELNQCLELQESSMQLVMGDCQNLPMQKQFVCTFNVIKTSVHDLFIGVDGNQVILLSSNYMTGWKRLENESYSICNTAKLKDLRKWWVLANNKNHVAAGSSPWVVALSPSLSTDVFKTPVITSSEISENNYGVLSRLSIQNNRIWGINPANDLYYGTLENGWTFILSEVVFLDFSMPGKGFIVRLDWRFCAREGITYSSPEGTTWDCSSDSVTIQGLSCGVTGCFSIIDGAVNFRNGTSAELQPGTSWIPLDNPPFDQLEHVAAGPVYELWAINRLNMVYQRVGMDDENPRGIKWERVSGILLREVSLGIYGPVGISAGGNEIMMLNGSPSSDRQHELDKMCEELSPCSTASAKCRFQQNTSCHARSIFTTSRLWRCFSRESLSWDGNAPNSSSPCYYTRDLNPIVLRPPVFGDLQRQLWLDNACNDKSINNNIISCKYKCFESRRYYADTDAAGKYYCRPKCALNSCSVKTGVHEKLLNVIAGSCADVSLLRPSNLPASSFRAKPGGDNAHLFRLNMNNWLCLKTNSRYLEIDFRFLHTIHAISFRKRTGYILRSFTLQYSSDNVSWKFSTLFGETKVFIIDELEESMFKYYLPAPIEARYIRLTNLKGSYTLCTKGEVYGCSKETEADSCEYYQRHLSATYDGFYTIYLPRNQTRQRVYCLGLNKTESAKTIPIHSDFKLFWPLNSTENENSVTLQGRTGVLLRNEVLGKLPHTCFSIPKLCVKGLTIEVWLCFSCFLFNSGKTMVLHSNKDNSAGYSLYIVEQLICFEVRNGANFKLACKRIVVNTDRWIHVLASWHLSNSLAFGLVVNDAAKPVSFISHIYAVYPKFIDDLLWLGDKSLGNDSECSVAVSLLTIWPRALSPDEIEDRFREGYFLTEPGESCTSVCERNQRSCYPIMDTNIRKAFASLGVNCTVGTPSSFASQFQPFVWPNGDCFGLDGLPDQVCCDCQPSGSRRLCRCEEPVNGNYTEWSNWSYCTKSCGKGRRVRSRTCTSPAPLYGGKECDGPKKMYEDCYRSSCEDNHGVFREMRLKDYTVVYVDALETFFSSRDLPRYMIESEKYTAYFHPPAAGSYRFVMNCTSKCQLRYKGPFQKYRREIIPFSLYDRPSHLLNEIITVTSNPVTMETEKVYYIEAINNVADTTSYYFALGCVLPNGQEQFPIPREYLTWKTEDPRGVSRKIWNKYSYCIGTIGEALNYISRNPTPDHTEAVDHFQTKRNFGEKYLQQLVTFFLTPISGSYTFSLSCSENCALFLSDGGNIANKAERLRISSKELYENRFNSLYVVTENLVGGKFYYLEVVHIDGTSDDFLTLGVTLSDGTPLQPIDKRYLWREIPENIGSSLHVKQSSTANQAWEAINAVDGNPNTCSHTNTEKDPWLRLALPFPFTVLTVVVTNRNSAPQRLDNFVVALTNTESNLDGPICSEPGHTIPASQSRAVFCHTDNTGKYLLIRLHGHRVLTVCELAIYGYRRTEYKNRVTALGLLDGRAEVNQFNFTYDQVAQFVHSGFENPYHGWCVAANSQVKLEITLNVPMFIHGVATRGNTLHKSRVSSYRLRFHNGSSWMDAVDTKGNQVFEGNSKSIDFKYHLFKEAYFAHRVVFLPLSWKKYPCFYLEIFVQSNANNYRWPVAQPGNTLTTSFSESDFGLAAQPSYSTVPLWLHGFDSTCLVNPKQCSGQFSITLTLTLKQVSAEGAILTTANFKELSLGTALFVENGQLVVSVQTESRSWRASGPVEPAVNTRCAVTIVWSYEKGLTLIIGDSSYDAMFAIRDHFVESVAQNQSLIIGGDNVDFDLGDFEIEIFGIDNDERISRSLSVDGRYSEWSPWSFCSKSCGGGGVQSRRRYCDNPFPRFKSTGCLHGQNEARPCSRPSCEDKEGVLREVWLNKRPPRFTLSNVTDGYPSVELVANFSCSDDGHSYYGQRLRAFLFAEQSGLFEFQLSCSFQCQLWISTNDEEINKLEVLSIDENGSSHPSTRTLIKKLPLVKGEYYYIEVKSFELKYPRNVSLLTIIGPDEAPMTSINGFSLVRHKLDNYYALGMESGAITDQQLSFNREGNIESFGRLNSPYPWCYEFCGQLRLTIDFIDLHWITALVVQPHELGSVARFSGIRYLIDRHVILSGLEDEEHFTLEGTLASTKILNFSQPLRVRYVSIHIHYYYGKGCLGIELIGCNAGNLAVGKPTEQVGVVTIHSTAQHSSYAVDGNFRQDYLKYCAITTHADNPFWSIDLEISYYISQLVILQRTDCCMDRLDNFDVRIGNENASSGVLNPRCGDMYSMVNLRWLEVNCGEHRFGRFITITQYSTNDLVLCEVAIFETENDTITSTWSECSVTCGEGFQHRQTECIKLYYCKIKHETRPCRTGVVCPIYMQDCRQLQLLGHNESGIYSIQPNRSDSESKAQAYCDYDHEYGGWMIIQRRNQGSVDFDQSWAAYKNGFGNTSTEFWLGNEIFHHLTMSGTYRLMVVFKYSNGTTSQSECDYFDVSSESAGYILQLGHCSGPHAVDLSSSNLTAFSTADHGLSRLGCNGDVKGGWWYSDCESLQLNGKLSCLVQGLCKEVTMMIRPTKVDGGWSNWADWEICSKPCGGGNTTRFRYCTHPPPADGGAYCSGMSNDTQSCNTHQCKVVELNITLKFTEETWSDDLLNPASSVRNEFTEKVIKNVKALYNNKPGIDVRVSSVRMGSIIADISIHYEAIDQQQLVVLQEDLDQDGLLNQDMPVVYSHSEIFVSEFIVPAPELVSLRNTSSTSLYVQWQPVNMTSASDELTGYIVYYRKQNISSLTMLSRSVQPDVLEIEITNLEKFTNYSIRLAAFSPSGNGFPTVAYNIMTDEDVPIDAPVIISSRNITSTSLFVEWQEVDILSFHGNPLGYMLYYRPKYAGNNTRFFNISIDDYQITNISISGLTKYTEYEIFMTAKTKKGEGIRGGLVNITTDEDVPSEPPQDITMQNKTSTLILLVWKSMRTEAIHGVLRGYMIFYWLSDNASEVRNITTGPLVNEVNVEGLQKFKNHSFSIAGITSKGIGNKSSTFTAQTCEDIPSRSPVNFKGFKASSTSINVSWSPIPRDYIHGIPKGYTVYYKDEFKNSGNITVPWYQNHLLLTRLHTYSVYNVSVVGFTKIGEGPRISVLIKTNDGAPSRAPWDFACPGVSSYTISLQWYPFTPRQTGSTLTGYTLSYKMIDPLPGEAVTFTVESFVKHNILTSLRAFSVYSIEIFVFNSVGRSNVSNIFCKTDEGKPLAYPVNVKAVSRIAPDRISVHWDHVPSINVAGIRKGYTIIYQRRFAFDEPVNEKENEVSVFDPDRREFVITNLDFFSEYSIKVLVFNNLYSGDSSPPVYADTCRCLSDFYVNWCTYKPYVNNSQSGIFPSLLHSMIYGVCANCSEHTTRIHMNKDYQGNNPEKSGLLEVKQSVTSETQINFPVLGRTDGPELDGISFLPVVKSPGSVFVTRKPKLSMIVSYVLIETVVNTMPLLGFSLVTAALAGILIWVLEWGKNEEHFPRNFVCGASEGFWWSFVSMTTVGYGDRFPKTFFGRIFGIIWTLYGLVITSLVIGNLTAGLVASVSYRTTDTDLYLSRIAALENSSEFKLGLMKGAHVNTVRNYSSIPSIVYDAKVGIVEGALLDMYVVSSLSQLQRKDSPLFVKMTINNPTSYGIALSGHAVKLKNPFSKYLRDNAAMVSDILEKNTRPVETSDVVEPDTNGEENEINVLAPDSPVIKKPLLYSLIFLGVMIVIGLFLHFTLFKKLRQKSRRNTVLPISNLHEQRVAMKECLNEFVKNSKCTINRLKQKHREELLNFAKRNISFSI